MSSEDLNILKDFQDESKAQLEHMVSLLDQCEEEPGIPSRLEEFGLTVDRIMGGAKSLATMLEKPSAILEQIGDYAGVCKAVGYKASQIQGNEQFYLVCVAFLQDATEVLEDLIERVLDQSAAGSKMVFSQALIDRLKWISNKFGEEYRATVAIKKDATRMTNDDIEALLKKLGV